MCEGNVTKEGLNGNRTSWLRSNVCESKTTNEDEVKANKAEKMKEVVKGLQETSEKQALIVDDSGEILDEGGAEVGEQIREAGKTL